MLYVVNSILFNLVLPFSVTFYAGLEGDRVSQKKVYRFWSKSNNVKIEQVYKKTINIINVKSMSLNT
jgi:hypothetical protein